jgi:hypothetical protein
MGKGGAVSYQATTAVRREDDSRGGAEIHAYERGKHEPQLKRATRLAEVLGIPPAFLYTEDDLLAVVAAVERPVATGQERSAQIEAATAPKPKAHVDSLRRGGFIRHEISQNVRVKCATAILFREEGVSSDSAFHIDERPFVATRFDNWAFQTAMWRWGKE